MRVYSTSYERLLGVSHAPKQLTLFPTPTALYTSTVLSPCSWPLSSRPLSSFVFFEKIMSGPTFFGNNHPYPTFSNPSRQPTFYVPISTIIIIIIITNVSSSAYNDAEGLITVFLFLAGLVSRIYAYGSAHCNKEVRAATPYMIALLQQILMPSDAHAPNRRVIRNTARAYSVSFDENGAQLPSTSGRIAWNNTGRF